jgi:class 3 adenylate cyclase/TolB-like protein/ketosteroid isomerase-like protein
MATSDTSRRLHGVLLADMTGFSRLMGEDEARAFAALTRIRDVFTRVVPRHGGTLDVLVGDCFVALFDSAVEAVNAAIAIQTELGAAAGPASDPVRIRIGVHMGDVVRSGSEIHGDSVNVAARLQTIAQPGRITLSDDVHRAVRNRINVAVRDLGLKSLKNIRDKMRVYEIDVAASPGAAANDAGGRALRAFVLAGIGVAAVAGLGYVGLHVARRGSVLDPPLVAPATPAPAAPAPPVVAALPPAEAPTPDKPLAVGITSLNAHESVPAWVKDNTRDGLNTLLSKVTRLRVFSREKIDFLRERRGLSEIEVAETLGIQKMIVGALAMDGRDVVLEARVVDIATGILDASKMQKGDLDELIDVQNRLAGDLLAALHVSLSDDERTQLFAGRTNETLDGYRRLADTFGDATGGAAPAPRPSKPKRSSWLSWPRTAWAADADPEPAIRAVLEAYRAALEAEDVTAVAAVHVELPPEQRDGFTRYFASADGLTVALSDLDVLLDGDEALVTFTRRDVFQDHASGKEMKLEVRLSSVVVNQDGKWLMRGVKRCS